MKTTVCTIALMLLALPCLAQQNADDICGRWLTADKSGFVEIYKRDALYFGKIVGGKGSGDSLDSKNPKPELRSRKLIGLDILKGLKFKGENDWGDGNIYDPNSGSEYSLFISLEDANTLALRGYMGISLFGRTEKWTRAK
jgi:uncharacterized protein (DUF2147 family)